MAVTGVANEVDAVDAVDRLGGDVRRVDRAIAKAEELEGDPDTHPISPIARELERVACCRDGTAGFEPRRARGDRQQGRRAQLPADLQSGVSVILAEPAVPPAARFKPEGHAPVSHDVPP